MPGVVVGHHDDGAHASAGMGAGTPVESHDILAAGRGQEAAEEVDAQIPQHEKAAAHGGDHEPEHRESDAADA